MASLMSKEDTIFLLNRHREDLKTLYKVKAKAEKKMRGIEDAMLGLYMDLCEICRKDM